MKWIEDYLRRNDPTRSEDSFDEFMKSLENERDTRMNKYYVERRRNRK